MHLIVLFLFSLGNRYWQWFFCFRQWWLVNRGSTWESLLLFTKLDCISCANVLFELLMLEQKFVSSSSVFFSFNLMISNPWVVSYLLGHFMLPQNLAEVHISFGQLSRVWPARKWHLEHAGRAVSIGIAENACSRAIISLLFGLICSWCFLISSCLEEASPFIGIQ